MGEALRVGIVNFVVSLLFKYVINPNLRRNIA